MLKRALSSFLWLISVWFGYELFLLVIDAPRFLGPLLGLSIAGFVMVDPRHLFWPAPVASALDPSAGEVIRVPEGTGLQTERAA
jgi:hypothetical protein